MTNEELPRIRVGYACLNRGFKESFRNFRLAAVEKKDEPKITEVIRHNITMLRKIIAYNVAHNIYVYRLSSDIVPFVTQPYVKDLYMNKIMEEPEMRGYFEEISSLQKQYNLRLSIHPGQFNVLASPKKEVVERSICEINEQADLVRQVGGRNVVLHIGGSYGDKKSAIKRFKENIAYIDKELLSVENDDKTYSAEEVWTLCQEEKLKWVYDYHHCVCHPSEAHTRVEMLRAYPPDKYHLSSGATSQTDRAHAELIHKADYIKLRKLLQESNIKEADVVFEAKFKNQAITEILEPLENGYWHIKGEKK